MGIYVYIVLMSLFSTCFGADLVKDVVYLPTTTDKFSEKTPIKKSSIAFSPNIPMAWITGDINKNPLRQISICTWVKSLDQSATGTIFAYSTSGEKIEFGLVGINTKETNKDDDTSHLVYVVIKGKRSKIPIDLELYDVRWHHVCVTWSSRYGVWKVYKDGEKIAQGLGMKRGKLISAGGRYYIGGGVFKWTDEENILNGSDISREIFRASTSFRTGRRKRDIYSTETKRLNGKFADFYVWGKVLSKNNVEELSNCNTDFRLKFNKKVKTETSYSNIFRTFKRRNSRRRSPLSWATRNVLYAWDTDTISLHRPATLEYSGDICGYQISIECETSQILVSVDSILTTWYGIQDNEIHLTNPNCVPKVIGNYLIFHLPKMATCGTQRKIVDREVHYINTVSNSPRSGEIYIGQLFKADVICKFPLDVTASTSQIIAGKAPEVVDKTTLTNPKTGKDDLEAVFVLSIDDSFSNPFRQGGAISREKSVWAGIAIQGLYENEERDVNVVVDNCWMDSEDERIQIMDQQGCGDSTARVLANGEKPNVRMEVPTRNMRPNTPTYIGCDFHPCVGDECTPACNKMESASGRQRERKTRDIIDEDVLYTVKAGPFYKEEITEIYETEEGNNNEVSTTVLVAAIVPSVIVFLLLVGAASIAIYFILKKSRRVHNINKHWKTTEWKQSSKRPIRAHSFTFCKPNYSAYNIYPPSYHAIVRAKFRQATMNDVMEVPNDVIEEGDDVYHQNTNTMISTVH